MLDNHYNLLLRLFSTAPEHLTGDDLKTLKNELKSRIQGKKENIKFLSESVFQLKQAKSDLIYLNDTRDQLNKVIKQRQIKL